jgi:hypothetical protein
MQDASRRDCRRYRYTFLRENEERAVAAFELFLVSQDAACELANELIEKSEADAVEVWCEGRLLVRFVKMRRQSDALAGGPQQLPLQLAE